MVAPDVEIDDGKGKDGIKMVLLVDKSGCNHFSIELGLMLITYYNYVLGVYRETSSDTF